MNFGSREDVTGWLDSLSDMDAVRIGLLLTHCKTVSAIRMCTDARIYKLDKSGVIPYWKIAHLLDLSETSILRRLQRHVRTVTSVSSESVENETKGCPNCGADLADDGECRICGWWSGTPITLRYLPT
jgi:ribosomal protein S27AE